MSVPNLIVWRPRTIDNVSRYSVTEVVKLRIRTGCRTNLLETR